MLELSILNNIYVEGNFHRLSTYSYRDSTVL